MKYKELTQNISGSLRTLSQDSLDLMKSFNQLSQIAMHDGVIDPKTKELIALAIGVAEVVMNKLAGSVFAALAVKLALTER